MVRHPFYALASRIIQLFNVSTAICSLFTATHVQLTVQGAISQRTHQREHALQSGHYLLELRLRSRLLLPYNVSCCMDQTNEVP